MKTVIGIDPSMTSTGVTVLDGDTVLLSDTIKTKPTDTLRHELERLQSIRDGIWKMILPHYVKGDSLAALEAPSFCSKTSSIVQLAGLNFLIRDAFHEWGIPLLIVPPMSLKKWVIKGSAKKEEMRLAVYKRWNVEFKTNDEIDSYALARLAQAWGKDESLGKIQCI